ncbi:H-2 class II histocompatibility antigen, E-Q beta chain-like isoform X1 [Colossoma macropomum]|uniref:H-2 class II histocompatibility antigen, E-Q beta chain-like isoform X1 n=1 Tax=Colossoma macropomum TaxID=42526 RepID=UPI001864C00A|nr:H-2 class II histocompatibility antigen, E-Q beta chain-like isoform X1 [Colossoma macropomum]XP_036416767.1 H-2 class II histocompatibility antigen, E-Q beta chain-like isoform X1 [Colossoma macropomum]
MILILQLLLALSLSLRADGYNWYQVLDCISRSSDLSDLEYINTYYFNKDPVLRFNSTVGEFVGYTELGVKNAERLNKGPEVVQQRAELERYCKPNLKLDYTHILDKAVKPKIRLTSEKHAGEGRPALLMCSAYGFYPPVIDVYWLRDGKKVTGDVVSTEEMANGNWYYQIHSHLEYTPTSGEKISCVVEHDSSKEPIIIDWGGSFTDSDRDKIIIGASGFVLGIILSTAGFLYYKKKSPEFL